MNNIVINILNHLDYMDYLYNDFKEDIKVLELIKNKFDDIRISIPTDDLINFVEDKNKFDVYRVATDNNDGVYQYHYYKHNNNNKIIEISNLLDKHNDLERTPSLDMDCLQIKSVYEYIIESNDESVLKFKSFMENVDKLKYFINNKLKFLNNYRFAFFGKEQLTNWFTREELSLIIDTIDDDEYYNMKLHKYTFSKKDIIDHVLLGNIKIYGKQILLDNRLMVEKYLEVSYDKITLKNILEELYK